MTTTPKDDALPKTCPICGGLSVVKHVDSTSGAYPDGYYWVGCEITLQESNPGCGIGLSKGRHEDAIAAWNRRDDSALRAAQEEGFADGLSKAGSVRSCGHYCQTHLSFCETCREIMKAREEGRKEGLEEALIAIGGLPLKPLQEGNAFDDGVRHAITWVAARLKNLAANGKDGER